MAVNGFDKQIAWSEFQKYNAAPAGNNFDSETVSNYNYSYGMARKGNALVITTADINIFVNGQQSWVVSAKMDPVLLKHEQGHFDITALVAREFYKKLFSLSAKTEHDLKKAMTDLKAAMKTKTDSTNVRYDAQTNHSLITKVQDQWNRAIAAEKAKQDGSIDNLP